MGILRVRNIILKNGTELSDIVVCLANVSTFEAISVEAWGRQSFRTLEPQTFFLILYEVALLSPYGNCNKSS